MAAFLRILFVAIAPGLLVGAARCSDHQLNAETAVPCGMKERFRFEFWKVGGFQRQRVIQSYVAMNQPFDIRTKNGATATGLLRRTEEGSLHFKGTVSHSGMSAVFDTTEDLNGAFFSGNTKGGPDSEGFLWIEVGFSLSHVEEYVPAGLGLGVSGRRDQVIVAPGPKPENRRPSEWFHRRLHTANLLTPDQETWLLFRSKRLKPTHLRIERIKRNESTFTVIMTAAEAAHGVDHYEVHGVNLDKLLAGTYEVKWIIGTGKCDRLSKGGEPAEWEELTSSFEVLKQ